MPASIFKFMRQFMKGAGVMMLIAKLMRDRVARLKESQRGSKEA
jgi:hypothetical protein